MENVFWDDTRNSSVVEPTCSVNLINEYTSVSNYAATPAIHTFFSPTNVQYIIAQIEEALHLLTGQRIRIPPNEEFSQTMVDVAKQNPGIPSTATGVAVLNRAVVEHETRIQYTSLRNRALWKKYYIDQDRMRTMPYGEWTASKPTIGLSEYSLSNPWKRHQSSYLRETAGLHPDPEAQLAPGQSMGYCKNSLQFIPKMAPLNQPPYTISTAAKTDAACVSDAINGGRKQ